MCISVCLVRKAHGKIFSLGSSADGGRADIDMWGLESYCWNKTTWHVPNLAIPVIGLSGKHYIKATIFSEFDCSECLGCWQCRSDSDYFCEECRAEPKRKITGVKLTTVEMEMDETGISRNHSVLNLLLSIEQGLQRYR
jgi:hypothetical protein